MDRSLRKSEKHKRAKAEAKAAKKLKEQRRPPKGHSHLNDVVEREVSRLLGERLASAVPPAAAAASAAMTVVKAPIPPSPVLEQQPPVIAPAAAPAIAPAAVEDVVSAAEVFDVGDAALAQTFAARMLARGVYVVSFSYPVVPMGAARIRAQVSAAHSEEDLEMAVAAFAAVNQELE